MKRKIECLCNTTMPALLYRNCRKSLFLFLLFVFPTLNSCQSTSSGESLRLITHNVWNGFSDVPDQKDAWIAWLNDNQPDVVGLQELNEYTPEKLNDDARQWGHSYSVLLKKKGFPTGITSKYPIEDVQRTLIGFHHGMLRAKIQGIYFYVVHLHPSNWETRSNEVDLLLQDIKSLPSDAHVVLAGDFNALSGADSIFYSNVDLEEFFRKRDMENKENNLKIERLDYNVISKITDFGFIDTELAGREKNSHFTGTFPTAVEKPGDHGDSRRLDYIFVSPSLSRHISHSHIIANNQTMYFSDHLPVLIDIKGMK